MNTTTTTYGVTQEQIDRCDRLVHENTGKVFYIVASKSEPGTYHKVQWNEEYHVLTCTCPAGNPPKNPDGSLQWAPRPCWHKRAVMAHNAQYKELVKAEKLAEVRQELESRVRNARPMPMPTAQEQAMVDRMNASREFKLMR